MLTGKVNEFGETELPLPFDDEEPAVNKPEHRDTATVSIVDPSLHRYIVVQASPYEPDGCLVSIQTIQEFDLTDPDCLCILTHEGVWLCHVYTIHPYD